MYLFVLFLRWNLEIIHRCHCDRELLRINLRSLCNLLEELCNIRLEELLEDDQKLMPEKLEALGA